MFQFTMSQMFDVKCVQTGTTNLWYPRCCLKTPAKGWCNKLCVNLRGLTLHTKKVFFSTFNLCRKAGFRSLGSNVVGDNLHFGITTKYSNFTHKHVSFNNAETTNSFSVVSWNTTVFTAIPQYFLGKSLCPKKWLLYIINHDQVCILYCISVQHDHNPTSNNKLKFQNRSTNNAFPNTASKAARTGRMSPVHAGQTKHHLHLLVPICLQICVFTSNHTPLTLPPAGSAIHSTTSSVSACGSLTHEFSAMVNLHHNTTKAHASNSPSMANNHILENHMFFLLQFAGIWIFLSCWSTNPPACTINFPHIAKIGWKMSKTPKHPGKTFFARTVSFFPDHLDQITRGFPIRSVHMYVLRVDRLLIE